jgi:hypothetical protein
MDNYKSITQGLAIFSRYEEDPGYFMAEHEEIWAGPNPSVVSTEDIALLDELGWQPWDTGNFHKYV